MSNHFRSRLTLVAALLCVALFASSSFAASDWNTDANGVFLNGYDVVAYHAENRAVRGSKEHSARHGGATFFFSSEANQQEFSKRPSAYLPKFGGYCAFGVAAQKTKAPVDPRTFKMYNGELLLFFNDLYQGQSVNTKVLWNQNENSLFSDAVAAWKAMNSR